MKKLLFPLTLLCLGGFFGFIIGRSLDPIDVAIRKAQRINTETRLNSSLRPGGAFNLFGFFSKAKTEEEEIVQNPKKRQEYFENITNQISNKEKAIDVLEDQREFLDLARQEVFIDNSLKQYLYTLGKLQLQNGMIYKAVTNLEQSYKIDPYHRAVVRLLALSYLGLYQTLSSGSEKNNTGDKAVSFAKRALELSPNDPEMIYGLALIYTDQEVYRDALPLFSQMLSQNPEDLNALLGVARIYFNQGELDKARRIYEQSEALILEQQNKKGLFRHNQQDNTGRLQTIRNNLEIIYNLGNTP